MSGQELSRLVADLLEQLRVFNTMDKLNIPEELLLARARNMAEGLRGGYLIVPHPEVDELATPVAAIGHGYGCPCGRCPGEFRAVWPRAWATREQLQAMYADGKPAGHLGSCRCDKCDTFNRSTKQKERS